MWYVMEVIVAIITLASTMNTDAYQLSGMMNDRFAACSLFLALNSNYQLSRLLHRPEFSQLYILPLSMLG